MVKFLKSKGDISISPSGDLLIGDSLNDKLKSFIFSSPTIKIALLNDLIGYENPNHSVQKSMIDEAKIKLSHLHGYNMKLTPENRETIL